MNRTLEYLRDNESGMELRASELLTISESEKFKLLRHKLAEDHRLGKTTIVCAFCNQPIHLAGNQKQEFYFKHYSELGDCPIKTAGKYNQDDIDRMRFNGVQESELHKSLKHAIHRILCSDVRCSKQLVESIRKSITEEGRWRKPDVSCIFQNKEIVFELQLSTTYLNVILEREAFYRANNTFIIWVFHEFNTLKEKFVQKDAYYLHKGNIFIFDEEALRRSESQQKLILHCYARRCNASSIEWADSYVELGELTYEVNPHTVYFKDLDLEQLRSEFSEAWLRQNECHYGTDRTLELRFKRKFKRYGIELRLDSKLCILLNAIYSMKTDQIVGYKYKKSGGLVQIAHLLVSSAKSMLHAFFHALPVYGCKDRLQAEDKTKKLKAKIVQYNNNKFKPECDQRDRSIEPFLCFLFPELEKMGQYLSWDHNFIPPVTNEPIKVNDPAVPFLGSCRRCIREIKQGEEYYSVELEIERIEICVKCYQYFIGTGELMTYLASHIYEGRYAIPYSVQY